MAVQDFFRDKSIQFHFDEQVALELRENSDAHAMIEKIPQKRERFKASLLTRFGLSCPFFGKTLPIHKHRLFAPGPTKRVSPQAARECER